MGKSDTEIIAEVIVNALKFQDIECIRKILQSESLILNDWLMDLGVTALHLAVGSGTEGFAACITHDMLRCGADPNAVSADGMTPVHVAAAWGRSTVLHLLLLHGGDPWRQDDQSRNAFSYAFETKAWPVIDTLHSAQVDNYTNHTRPQCCYQPHSPVRNRLIHSSNVCNKCEQRPIQSPSGDESHSTISSSSDTSPVFIRHSPTSFSVETRSLTATPTTHHCKEERCDWSSSNESSSAALASPSRGEYQPNLHNVTFCIETRQRSPPSDTKSEPKFITTRTYTVSKESVLQIDSDEVIKNEPLTLSANLDEPDDKIWENPDKRLTYTVTPKKPVQQKENKQFSRADLFEELSRAVQERSVRMSGVSTLPLSDSCISQQSENATEKSFDLNKAVISESFVKKQVKQEEKIIENPQREPQDEAVNHVLNQPECWDDDDALDLALQTECRFSGGQTLDLSETSCSYVSLPPVDPNDSVSSCVSFVSCEQPDGYLNCRDEEPDNIRKELISFGVNPGPITPTTRSVYLRLLGRLQKRGPGAPPNTPNPPNTPATPTTTALSDALALDTSAQVPFFPSSYSMELENALKFEYQYQFSDLEEELLKQFSGLCQARSCFNYLLLDGRVTRNLPNRSRTILDSAVNRQFIAAIFYVGKGQASRPLEHLREAKLAWQHNKEGKNPKEAKILDIWKAGEGVVCARAFHDICKEEALTREAAMIEALRRQNLCNLLPGNFYGGTAHWSSERKKQLGVHLLFTAKDVFLQSGERSFRPADLI